MIAADALSFSAWLYRPYINLEAVEPRAPFHVYGLEFGIRAFIERRAYPRIQAALNSSFRKALASDLKDSRFVAIEHPETLPRELRTPRWDAMCEALKCWQDLASDSRVMLMWLICKLGFHSLVAEFLPQYDAQSIAASQHTASLAYLRGLARYRLLLDNASVTDYSISEFEHVAHHAPDGIAKIDAHYQMVAQMVKTFADLNGAKYWQRLHAHAIDAARDLDDFTRLLVGSRFHRVGGFIPQMEGNAASVADEMSLAEEIALALPRRDELERIAADEMLYPAIESRIKEALWIGDYELAESRSRRLTILSPYDPRAWLHLAEVLLERESIEDAIGAFRRAALYAPPGREIAFFMLGQCFENLGDLESARDAYVNALNADPLGLSSAEALLRVSRSLGLQLLSRWSSQVLDTLQSMASPPASQIGEAHKSFSAPVQT